ncbi:LacI family DNA-binding transcriptional regulator [Nocardioides sp. YIM 152588]|uniref:LacI family DNA-binding transcriptional regulator n=1 Tax=Nocardioides sp. YIM 152588 TaxID=3158259 RepID=UPI0032E40927
MAEQAEEQAAERAPGRPVTSVDVARLAGVSRATVSHILNHQVQRFTPRTVERVLAAAAELGYVKSAAARALALGHSDIVILVVPDTTLSNLQDVIEAVSAQLQDLGFATVVHFAGPQGAASGTAGLTALVDMLRPAGVLDLGEAVPPEQAERLRASGAVVVAEYGVREAGPMSDGNVLIGRLQAEHLVAQGYRRLAYASLDDGRRDPWGRDRAAGVAALCAELGLDPPAHLEVPLDRAGAREAVRTLVGGDGPALGVACFSDDVAIAVLAGAREVGVEVPGQVGIIGFAGSPVGQLVAPRLTSLAADVDAGVAFISSRLASVYGLEVDGAQRPAAEVFEVVQGGTT